MSSTLRGLLALGVMAVMTLAAVASAHADTPAQISAQMAKVTKAALQGPTARDLVVNGHKFHVKKATVTYEGLVTVVKGQISHVLRLREDDQVNYTIRKRGGKVISIKVEIDRGGITKYITDFLADNFGLVKYEDDMNDFIRKVAFKLTGNWESTAALMLNCIALEAPDKFVMLPPGQTIPQGNLQTTPPTPQGTLHTAPKSPLGLPTGKRGK